MSSVQPSPPISASPRHTDPQAGGWSRLSATAGTDFCVSELPISNILKRKLNIFSYLLEIAIRTSHNLPRPQSPCPRSVAAGGLGAAVGQDERCHGA